MGGDHADRTADARPAPEHVPVGERQRRLQRLKPDLLVRQYVPLPGQETHRVDPSRAGEEPSLARVQAPHFLDKQALI